MGIWGKKKGEDRVEREESGKLVNVKLSRKTGDPILGFTSPKGEDQATRLRLQARELVAMAEKLERLADEMDRKNPGGKAAGFIRKWLRRGVPDGTGSRR